MAKTPSYQSLLDDQFALAEQIGTLTFRIRGQLRSRQMIDFFLKDRVNNPESPKLAPLLASAKALKSYCWIFDGYKESVDSQLAAKYPTENYQSELLDSREALKKSEGWVQPGIILAGLSGATIEAKGPRVVVEVTETGCTWRYLVNDTTPKPQQFDKFYNLPDWVEVPNEGTTADQLKALKTIYQEEVTKLSGFVDYLNERRFLAD
jgi:hypothetical protein